MRRPYSHLSDQRCMLPDEKEKMSLKKKEGAGGIGDAVVFACLDPVGPRQEMSAAPPVPSTILSIRRVKLQKKLKDSVQMFRDVTASVLWRWRVIITGKKTVRNRFIGSCTEAPQCRRIFLYGKWYSRCPVATSTANQKVVNVFMGLNNSKSCGVEFELILLN